MKNNILGFAVYLLAAILFSPSTSLILLTLKENTDRCHYYDGKWNKTDLVIGISAITVGIIINEFILYNLVNKLLIQ